MEIFEEILRLKRDGRVSALATIVQAVGSSPQKEGAKMLVRDDGTVLGTLGGGCLEAEVKEIALMTMRGGSPISVPFDLTEKEGGLVCGGKILVYIEPIVPEPNLIILGAGHVGKALSHIAKFAGFRVTVADDREEFANREAIPHADEIVVEHFDRVLSDVSIDNGCYVVIATRGHNHDLEALAAALRTDAGYIGLLGSRRKKALLLKALRERGFSEREIGRVVVPVGLPIGSVTPEEIAVSIMAQVIQKRRGNAAPGVCHSPCGGVEHEDGAGEATPAAR